MKYKIGDKLKSKIGNMVIEIIGFEGKEYVVTWEGGFPNALDEGHIEEYYDKL